MASNDHEATKPISNNVNNSENSALVKQHAQEVAPTVNEKLFEQAIDLGDATAYLKYPRKLNTEQVSILRIHLEATLIALETRNKKMEETKKEQAI